MAVRDAEESSTVDVLLAGSGDKKIQVIKVVRAATGLGLKEAKALVDEAPKPVKEGIEREEADKLKQELEEAGGHRRVEVAPRRRGPRSGPGGERSARRPSGAGRPWSAPLSAGAGRFVPDPPIARAFR